MIFLSIIALLLALVAPIISFGVLIALPSWMALRVFKRNRKAFAAALMVVPAVTIASEAYPLWHLRELVRGPLESGINSRPLNSIYGFNGYAPEAVRLVVQYPNVRFTEGLIDKERQEDRSVFGWSRMPVGVIRFTGRRAVRKADDCGDSEVTVPIVAHTYPNRVTWYCTAWRPEQTVLAESEVEFETRNYNIGPYSAFERKDYIVERTGRRQIRALIQASISGGLFSALGGYLSSISGLSPPTPWRYSSSTARYLKTAEPEEYLIIGTQ